LPASFATSFATSIARVNYFGPPPKSLVYIDVRAQGSPLKKEIKQNSKIEIIKRN
jgi:hypothetical protein